MRLPDSGERRQFDTGAVRDISEGKGRCDLLPLDVVGAVLEDDVLKSLDQFMRDTTNFSFALYDAIKRFCKKREWDYPTAMLEVSKHFEDGAVKYGDNNWRKGIPLHCYIDSAVRHYLKWLKQDSDEPHDRACLWNLLCAAWTLKNVPGMVDLTCYQKEKTDEEH